VWAGGDAGAVDTDSSDFANEVPEGDQNRVLGRIRMMFGPGHAWAVILRTVMGVLWCCGLFPLVEIYGYALTPTALDCLKRGVDLRKTRDFIYCIREAGTNAFVREYLHTLPVEERRTADPREFMAWMNDSNTTDVMFRSLAAIFFRVLPAFQLLERGMRNNSMVHFWSAALTLLPLLVLRNNHNYVPVFLREVAIYQYLCPDPVLQQYKLIWCYFGQGLDFILEEIQRRIKRGVTRGSFNEFLVSSIAQDQQNKLIDNLLRQLGEIPPVNEGEYVEKYEANQVVILAMEKWFIDNRVCRKDPDRTTMTTWDGTTPLLPTSGMHTMLDTGTIETAKYAKDYAIYRATRAATGNSMTPYPKLPKPYPLTQEELGSGSDTIAEPNADFAWDDDAFDVATDFQARQDDDIFEHVDEDGNEI
jgi:hypothetical protein